MAVNPSSLPQSETFTSLPSSEIRLLSNIDPATGELLEHDCEHCNRLAAQVAGLETDLDATQDKLTQALTQIKALKTQDENRRLRHRLRPRIEAIVADWQKVCDKPRSKLTSDRHDAIAAALNLGYDEQVFHLASLGARHNNPWKPRKGEPPMMEIATFAKGSWLEQFANAGAQWQAAQKPGPVSPLAGPLEMVLGRLTTFKADGQDRFIARCPSCDERDGSLCVRHVQTDEGEYVALDCYVGCTETQVADALGVGMHELVSTEGMVRGRVAPLPEHLRVAVRMLMARGEELAA